MDTAAYLAERFTVDPNTGCWNWALSVGSHGYGQACTPSTGPCTAHRLTYSTVVGPIPDGYQIDHLCRNRCCINPDHLEAVPQAVNVRRQYGQLDDLTTCGNGHGADHFFYEKGGKRRCRQCATEAQARFRQRRREAAHAAA